MTEEKKPVTTVAPLLYDLTSLQREAANRYGFSAKRTLQLAQECYEKHKVLTYPRTDSRYLPEDYLGKVYGIVGTVAEQNPEFAPFARDILDNKRIKPNRRVFDTKKVSDHFAIIPTGKMEKLTLRGTRRNSLKWSWPVSWPSSSPLPCLKTRGEPRSLPTRTA